MSATRSAGGGEARVDGRRDQGHPEVFVAGDLMSLDGDDATRGFGYLQEAGRLDLTVEALVADETKPYHKLFSPEAVAASAARLAHARAAMAAADGTANGEMKLSTKAQSILDALVPHVGGREAVAAEAKRLAHFEGDKWVRGWHVLRAAELYSRRPTKEHDSV